MTANGRAFHALPLFEKVKIKVLTSMTRAIQKAWWPLISPHLVSELDNRAELQPSVHRLGRELPFRVRLARTHDQLSKAIGVRKQAYSKHLPTLSDVLGEPERADKYADSIVLLAESKDDAVALGTMRIQSNFKSPLDLESEIALPERFCGRPIAHVTRLGVLPQKNSSLIKLALFKALHRYCLALQIDWILATGIPPIDRQYDRLDFEDVFPDRPLIALRATGGIPARLLAWEVGNAERRAHNLSHPLYEFMFQTYHPDIEVFNSVKGMWAQPRVGRAN